MFSDVNKTERESATKRARSISTSLHRTCQNSHPSASLGWEDSLAGLAVFHAALKDSQYRFSELQGGYDVIFALRVLQKFKASRYCGSLLLLVLWETVMQQQQQRSRHKT